MVKFYKRFLTIGLLCFALGLIGFQAAQAAFDDAPHKLVIQVNKHDAELYNHILSNINNLQKFYGVDNIQIEVVAYGPGIWMLTEESSVAQRIAALQMQEVVFTACTNTLDTVEREKGTRPVLLKDVKPFEAGIARIMELQEAGYSYLSP